MRSQTKTSPKKGAVTKTTPKTSAISKQSKKKVSPKKVKSIANKTLGKGVKKTVSDKSDVTTSKSDGASTSEDKNDFSAETSKIASSKTTASRSNSPAKKTKKNSKKDAAKATTDVAVKKIIPKKQVKTGKKSAKPKIKKKESNADDVKYKINSDVAKKAPKFSKAKTVVKKGVLGNQKKKSLPVEKHEQQDEEEQKEESSLEKEISNKNEGNNKKGENTEDVLEDKIDNKVDVKNEEKIEDKDFPISPTESSTSSTPSTNNSDTPKAETERPLKFFTSSRTPRTVDIDVKCCKTSKGSLSVSERFLSMKCEPKIEDNNKDKNSSNALVSQGAEIDVYTFTEKVDSPKSILTDFRSPIPKNVGRVRPIARVKGTIIDKKSDSEKKKYSPHRPIEEVVKQLKANKRTEELNASATQIPLSTSEIESVAQTEEKDAEEKPKPIVSKSYKMVARKSSVTGKPFSPIKFLDNDSPTAKTEKSPKTASPVASKKPPSKPKKQQKKPSISDEEIDTSKFSLSSTFHYTSSEESVGESNDDNDTKESSSSDTPKSKKVKNKKYKRITDSAKKPTTSKELKELSKDSLVDLKDNSLLMGEKPSKRRLKLLSMWTGPKKHRMASLNAMAKVHCLYENESRTHMELGLMKTVDRQAIPSTSTATPKSVIPKKKDSKAKDAERPMTSTSGSEYETKAEKKDESSESSDDNRPSRTLRGVPGIRSAGKYWDPKSSTSSSEDSELETKKKNFCTEKKKVNSKTSSATKSDTEKPPAKMKKTAGVPVKKQRKRTEVLMEFKDMVVQKRMASLNATAILAASYEKRSPKSSKDDTTSDSCSDESFSTKPKNGVSSGVKSEAKSEEPKKEIDETAMTDKKQKVEVIVNQDTDVTITGVYSTHHEGFCTAMQYRISSTSHTQTTATANCEKEGCSREDGARYTPLSALSSMQPPAEHVHTHPHPVPELGGLARRAGCSSAFSAPSPSHHEPGYYQPAGPLIKESGADAERALARYHPQPHYHAPHPSVLQQYGPPYYPTELCYGRYYRPSGAYHMPPPQPDAQMVGVGSEPYPPPQYYGTPPCYQHSPQRIPYVEYRCPCPINACPKNVLIGPATGKAPTGGGPDVPSALAPPGGAFRAKVRACALDAVADTHGSGKDPPLESEPPAAADAPHPCPLPAIGGASPKRELYDVRDNLRLAGDLPGPAEPIGPPSPARGSAGACAPQPPPAAPRRARLGKAMARRSLAGDDTGLLLSVPQPSAQHSDADDDVLAISPPVCAPIDLSSSDERSTPLVDVKKENEGPTNAQSRKTDAQALREHNCTTVSDQTDVTDTSKAVKRRYSRPKLEIDMKDTQLEDSCKTNGIGEHVKLQKRRKVSGEQTDVRLETITKEPKKKTSPTKRTPKAASTEKKTLKRKLESVSAGPQAKKALTETVNEDPRLKNVAAVADEPATTKPKTKSALLLDNLIRKNSIDRPDAKGFSEAKLNPAELFFSPDENVAQNCTKKTLNINNNVVDSANAPVNGVRPKTIAAVSQLIGKKLAYKNPCKVEKVDSKITHNLKSVLKTPTVEEDQKISEKSATGEIAAATPTEKSDSADTQKESEIAKELADKIEAAKMTKPRPKETCADVTVDESQRSQPESEEEKAGEVKAEKAKRKLTNGDLKAKNVEKVVKLLVSKRPAIKTDEATLVVEDACSSGGARRPRRRRSGAVARRRRPPAPLAPPDAEPRAPPRSPRWSNGWSFDGDHYVSKVYLNNDSRLDRVARCWARMTHASGDSVSRGDCVLLRASLARAQPFVARVASLWQNPEDGEMMVSLVWYYRPEHTDRGRAPADAPDEVFASRHRDANSVACIEDKCYVLTFNEYCRYRKRLKAAEEGITIPPSIVPPPPPELAACAPNDAKLPPSVSPELVLFCRKVYDFRSKKIHVPNK